MNEKAEQKRAKVLEKQRLEELKRKTIELVGANNLQYCDAHAVQLIGNVIGTMERIEFDLKNKISYPEARNKTIHQIKLVLKLWEELSFKIQEEKMYRKYIQIKKEDANKKKKELDERYRRGGHVITPVMLTKEVFEILHNKLGYTNTQISQMTGVSCAKITRWVQDGFEKVYDK